MKISKRTVGVLSAGMSIILIGTGSLVAANLFKKSADPSVKEKKPLDRGDNYEQYKISSMIQNNKKLTDIVSLYVKDNKYQREINSNKFKDNMIGIIKDVLGNVAKFKGSIDKYEFDLHYQIGADKKSCLVDVTWDIPSSSTKQYYYYDQFQISISNKD